MGMRERIEDRIKKKREELVELEVRVRETKSYIQALEDMAKALPREDASVSDTELRHGSMLALTRDLLKKQGHALHVMDILRGIGKEPTKGNRASLSGSINGHIKKGGQVFKKTGPNVFALVEHGSKNGTGHGPDVVDAVEEEFTK
jgi:hypothetical protein